MKIKHLYRWLLIGIVGLLPLLTPLPASARSVKITLTITELLKIDNVDGAQPGGFYARVMIGQGDWQTSGYVVNADHVRPNWTFEQSTEADVVVPILVTIWDYDRATRDVMCDVSPVYGQKPLQIYYHLATGQISGDVDGTNGQLLTTTGMGDGDRVLIWFRVSEAPPPPAVGVHGPGYSGSEAPPPPAVGVHGPVWIDDVTPQDVYPGDILIIHGARFGAQFDRSGSQPREKRVLLIPAFESGGTLNPNPVTLEIWNWSQQSIQVRIPSNLRAGKYRLGIFASPLPDGRNGFGSVSNFVTVNVLGF